MLISKQTLDIAKNFAAINSNFLIKKGKIQQTMSVSRDIMAEIEFAEDFPQEAGIFNMNEFLGVISLFSTPDFAFDTKYVTVSEGKNKIKYVYADASLLTVPNKTLVMPTPEVTLDLSEDSLKKMQKAANVLSVGDLAIIGDGKTLTAKVFDIKNPTSNNFELELGEHTGNEFEVYFKLDKLVKLYPGSYTVQVSSKKISQFKHNDINLKVWIAIEANSKFV